VIFSLSKKPDYFPLCLVKAKDFPITAISDASLSEQQIQKQNASEIEIDFRGVAVNDSLFQFIKKHGLVFC